jgi:probable F420-dependent oxidoreductase
VLFPEHTHVPVTAADQADPGDVPIPSGADRLLDPMAAMAAAAAVTTNLRVGTAVCLVTQRDPIICAKEIASIDLLSGGRVLFGVGAGWNLAELRNHGTDPSTRFRLMRERVEAMRLIWTQEEATYKGRLVRFAEIRSWPKPAQSPHPPILIGSDGPGALDRVIEYGDHWMPVARRDSDDALMSSLVELRQRATDVSRPIGVTVSFAPTDPARLVRYAEAGVDRCVFALRANAGDDYKGRLDRVHRAVSAADTLTTKEIATPGGGS